MKISRSKTLNAVSCVALGMMVANGTLSTALGQGRTQRGATLGGVAGAVIGGIIGHQNDETTEGILIGSAVGAIAGGVAGHSQDAQYRRYQNWQQPSWQNQGWQAPGPYSVPPRPAYGGVPVRTIPYDAVPYDVVRYPVTPVTPSTTSIPTTSVSATGVTIADIVQMSQSGLSESIIINHIQRNGLRYQAQTADIISLHRSGVSEPIINAVQSAPLANQVAKFQSSTPPEPTVVVPQPIYGERIWYPREARAYRYDPNCRRGF